MTPAVVLAMMVLVSLWGSAFPMIKVGLDGLNPFHLTLARHLVASACFVPVLWLRRLRRFPDRRDLPAFLLLGLLGFTIYQTALVIGEVRVPAGASSLIIATAPAITAVLAHLLLSERMPLGAWFGSLLALTGVALISLGAGGALTFNPYALFVLLSAVSTSFFAIAQRRMFVRYRAVEVTAFATWAGTAPMLLFLPGFLGDVASAGPASLAAVAYIGIFPSALAYSLFAIGLSRAPVTVVTTYLYLVPVSALFFSWLVLREVPHPLTIAGGAVAIVGIVLVNAAKQRAARRAAAVRG
jgi:drug/metabolite transporter (DMT)-like permease